MGEALARGLLAAGVLDASDLCASVRTDERRRALAAGPGAWTTLGQAGKARVRALYSVQAMTRATIEAYAALLASRASAAA